MNIKNRVKEMRMMSATEISANEKNWRTHPDKQSRALSGLLEEIGIAGALLCYYSERNGGALTLIDGHLRKEVAPGEEWPVLITDLTDEEADTLLAVYDPVAAMAGAERERLAALIEGVRVQDARLRELVAGVAKENGVADPTKTQDAEPQIDRAEELRVKWGVETGQLWELGDHKLLCGDSTKAEDVALVMGGEKADTLVSDPPYGIGYTYDQHDDKSNEENKQLIVAAWEFAPSAKVWSCGLMNLIRDIEWNKGAKVLCWHKGFARAGNGLGGASTWEPVLVVGVKNGTLPNDYLHFGTDRVEGLRDLHSCPKPIALFEHLIEHLAGQIIYEPFCGSGTTIIACENLGRKCRAIEISPGYVAVALQRWADATGKTPVLLSKE